MKKLIVFATALMLSVSVILAQDAKPVPAYIVKELNKEFGDVSNLQWKTVNTLYKGSFIADGTQLEAFYSFDGKLTAVSRKLTLEQLPMVLLKAAKEKAMTHRISELFELLTEKGTEYFMVINNEKETKNFRSEGNYWNRY